ncbi:GNAT family N-acetyltransferase [Nakamurella deserti]|uniref:GNAT family N-acetyltransferase n=1 Tax=Nakamurella deserti TaxID=2164074 RepID=UPI001F0CA81F|nr:GNAT family N-acetyltransferase [Nakamurella deserti]
MTLRPMTADVLDTFRRVQLDGYITQRVEFGGEDHATATAVATDQNDRFFPGGVPAEGHALFTAHDADGARVGALWLFRRSDTTVWIYDVEIDEGFRGRGLGRALMLAAHGWAQSQGATVVELNVFGGNAVARALYTSLGYTERSVHMAKTLVPEPQEHS